MDYRKMRLPALLFLALMAATPSLAIEKCGSGARITCVVYGDTLWIDGTKYRTKGYDTPEPRSGICGGRRETELASRATNRLIELINTTEVEVYTLGERGSFGRDLVDIYSDGRNVGDILVEEGLARYWPDGEEFWCH